MLTRVVRGSSGRRLRPARFTLFAALSFAAVLSGAALAQDHTAHASTEFIAEDYSFEGPSQLSPGWQTIALRNNGTEMHHIQFTRLADGVTPDQFFTAFQSEGGAALRFLTFNGGVGMIPPGASAEVLVDFTKPGTYVVLCFLPNAEGVPHLALGMTDVIEVVGEPTGVEEPAADFEVHMFDFAYTMPSSVPAGTTTWKVVNDGPQPHEMTLVKLNDGVTFEAFMQHLAEHGEEGMPGTPIGGAQALHPNLASYLTYDLQPGEYAALCAIPDQATGTPHVQLGMLAGFSVEASN